MVYQTYRVRAKASEGVSSVSRWTDWKPYWTEDGDHYPCTVVRSRYGGTYEGGEWLAFPVRPSEMPYGWDGGDLQCAEFFGSWDKYPIGRGRFPEDAILDLRGFRC